MRVIDGSWVAISVTRGVMMTGVGGDIMPWSVSTKKTMVPSSSTPPIAVSVGVRRKAANGLRSPAMRPVTAVIPNLPQHEPKPRIKHLHTRPAGRVASGCSGDATRMLAASDDVRARTS